MARREIPAENRQQSRSVDFPQEFSISLPPINIVCFVGFYSARRGLDGNLRKTFNNSGVNTSWRRIYAVSGVHYPPETVAIMSRVLDECMATLVNGHPADPTTLEGVRVRSAQIILGAVAERGGRIPKH